MTELLGRLSGVFKLNYEGRELINQPRFDSGTSVLKIQSDTVAPVRPCIPRVVYQSVRGM
jgi:hypothetical protein